MSKKCLIVDDVVVSRYACRVIAESLGLDVVEAEDEEQCMSELSKTTYDVIILDWHLRRASGLDLIEKIRAQPNHHRVFIIICSGVKEESAPEQAKKAGADSFIVKPTTKEKLEQELKKRII